MWMRQPVKCLENYGLKLGLEPSLSLVVTTKQRLLSRSFVKATSSVNSDTCIRVSPLPRAAWRAFPSPQQVRPALTCCFPSLSLRSACARVWENGVSQNARLCLASCTQRSPRCVHIAFIISSSVFVPEHVFLWMCPTVYSLPCGRTHGLDHFRFGTVEKSCWF